MTPDTHMCMIDGVILAHCNGKTTTELWQVVSLRKLRAAHVGNLVGEGHTLICTTKHRLRANGEGNAATQNIHTYLPMGCGKVVA